MYKRQDGSRSVTVNGTDTQAEVQQNFVKVSLGSGTYELVYDTGTCLLYTSQAEGLTAHAHSIQIRF